MQNRHLRYQNIQPIFSVGDPLLLSDLKAIKIEDSDCIILLQNTDSIPLSPRGKLNERSSVSDTQSITTIAHIQHILKGQAQQARRTADRLKLQKKPRLIAECADPSTLALLTDMTTGPLWGKSDIFLPKHIESGVVVQVVLDMRLTAVFEGLLQPNGVELGFRSPSEYGYGTPSAAAAAAAGGRAAATTTFYDVCARARARGEVAVGIERRDGKTLANWAEDLNPNKYNMLVLSPNDRIVVLAEEKAMSEAGRQQQLGQSASLLDDLTLLQHQLSAGSSNEEEAMDKSDNQASLESEELTHHQLKLAKTMKSKIVRLKLNK